MNSAEVMCWISSSSSMNQRSGQNFALSENLFFSFSKVWKIFPQLLQPSSTSRNFSFSSTTFPSLGSESPKKKMGGECGMEKLEVNQAILQEKSQTTTFPESNQSNSEMDSETLE